MFNPYSTYPPVTQMVDPFNYLAASASAYHQPPTEHFYTDLAANPNPYSEPPHDYSSDENA